ncbi:hypothetical protein MKX03_004603 [Papaver bracteatum]|nr:hypothetical protein MKX03_004603 [Papaver bracteatum]
MHTVDLFIVILITSTRESMFYMAEARQKTCAKTRGGPACTNSAACNSYCNGLYQDGEGVCNRIEGTPQRLCLCYFDCKSGPAKRCTRRGPPCTDSAACNSYCSGHYQRGVGFCNPIEGTPQRLCFCQFDC